MSDEDDRRRTQRAALSIGLSVGIASAIVIAGGVGILIAAILLNQRPEGEHGGERVDEGLSGDDFVIDADRLLPLVIALGVVGVILLGVVAWLAARGSVRPLGEALRLQRNFVADASHELRTPLTALSSRIQVLQRRLERGEPLEETIVELRRDAATMADVLGDMLLAAEGGSAADGRSTSVVTAVRSAVESLAPLADDAQLELRVAANGDALVPLPSVTLVRLVVALVDNAIQHSPIGSVVEVDVATDAAATEIRVTDHGSGIRGIEPDAVFERFARSAESGRRRGFGLGLALVRDVAVRAGGIVAVESTSDAGTTFLLRLPTAS